MCSLSILMESRDKGLKCIFTWYFKESKGYLFIGENKDGIKTEFELRSANFLNFFHELETTWDIEFFKIEDELAFTSKGLNPLDSGSGPSLCSQVPPTDETQELWWSQCGRVPRWFQEFRGKHTSWLFHSSTMWNLHPVSKHNVWLLQMSGKRWCKKR